MLSVHFPAFPAAPEEKASDGNHSDSVRLRKLPKFQHREDEATQRRQTIAVPDEVAEAIASQSLVKRGRAGIRRESSVKLPVSSGQQEAESELAQAFSKFHRRASQIAQSASTNEPKPKSDVRDSVVKPPKPVHSVLLPSRNSAFADSQPARPKSVLSQPSPVSKSMSSLAADKKTSLRPQSVATSLNFQPSKVRFITNTKKHSVTPASGSSDSSYASAQESGKCIKNPTRSEFARSVEIEKCSAVCGSVSRSSDKQETKSLATQCHGVDTKSVSHSVEISTSSRDAEPADQPGCKPESKSLIPNSSPSTNLERTEKHFPKLQHPDDSSASKKQMSVSTMAETVSFSTSLLNEESIPVVESSLEVDAQQPSNSRELFERQKSCPEKTEHHVVSAVVQLSRSSDAAGEVDVRHSLDGGLRSRASWTTDGSGNKLEIKLKKSHSIALKPRKPSTTDTDTLADGRPALLGRHKRTTSTVDSSVCHPPPQQRDSSPFARRDRVSAELRDVGTSVADVRAASHVECIHSLKAGKAASEKKLSSVAGTGNRCEEPSWLALARQKRQRWTEGSMLEECYHYA